MPFDAPLIAPDLQTVGATAPKRRWLGVIELVEGAAAPVDIVFWVDLAIAANALDGAGATDEGNKVLISGSNSTGSLRLRVTVSRRDADLCFECFGSMSADETEIAASASLPCVYPESCRCFGHRGALTLVRVSEPARG